MTKSKLINVLAIFTILFILLPLLMIIVTSFGEAKIIQFPIKGFTFDWYKRVFESQSFMEGLKVSAILGVASSTISVFVATITSYSLYKIKGKIAKTLLSFFLSPNLIPGIVLGIMLYRIMVINFGINLLLALLIGHILILLPYSIRVIASGLNEFDTSTEEAAMSLGATRIQTVFLIVIPYLKTSILAAFMMSFINSFNNLPVSMYLKAPGLSTLPVTLMNYIEYSFDPSVSAMSVILMIFTFILMRVMDRILGIKKVY